MRNSQSQVDYLSVGNVDNYEVLFTALHGMITRQYHTPNTQTENRENRAYNARRNYGNVGNYNLIVTENDGFRMSFNFTSSRQRQRFMRRRMRNSTSRYIIV